MISASDFTKKHILIENAELNDPIEVSIICGDCDAMISVMESPHPLPGEIDITRFFAPQTDTDGKSIFDYNNLF